MLNQLPDNYTLEQLEDDLNFPPFQIVELNDFDLSLSFSRSKEQTIRFRVFCVPVKAGRRKTWTKYITRLT